MLAPHVLTILEMSSCSATRCAPALKHLKQGSAWSRHDLGFLMVVLTEKLSAIVLAASLFLHYCHTTGTISCLKDSTVEAENKNEMVSVNSKMISKDSDLTARWKALRDSGY